MSIYQKTEANLRAAIARALRSLRPPPDLTVSQWAERYRYLSAEASAEAGKWHNDRTPHLVEPMDAYSDPGVEEIVLMFGAQSAKTELINNCVGYDAHINPGPIMVLNYDIRMMETWSKDRLMPMFRDSPVLSGLLPQKSRSTHNTIAHKQIPGGHITCVNSRSPAALASRPIRSFFADEVDRYSSSSGKEGDPLNLADVRTRTFYNRKKVRVSTPLMLGASRIHQLFLNSSMGEWCVPCPHCGEYHTHEWERVMFNREAESPDDIGPITIACPHCGAAYDSTHCEDQAQAGKWVHKYPDRKVRGFHMGAFGSLLASWEDLCRDFILQRDDPEQLKAWWNTALGLPFEEQQEALDADDLRNLEEDYEAPVPDDVLLLTCMVDVQVDRLEYEIVGWGEYEESWGIERRGIYGDPTDESAAVWKELDDLLRNKRWTRKSGHSMGVYYAMVDSGYQATTVYQRVYEMRFPRVFPCKGAKAHDAPIAKLPAKVRLPNNARLRLFWVGTQDAKTVVAQRMRLTKPGPGYCHLPRGYPDNFYEEMTAEVRVPRTVGHQIVSKWERIPNRANESVDLRAYGLSAIRSLHPSWADFRKRISEVEIQPAPAPTGKDPAPDVNRPKVKRTLGGGRMF